MPVDFNKCDYDSDAAVSVGSNWKFSVDKGKLGLYFIRIRLAFDAAAVASPGDQVWLGADLNGATASATSGIPYKTFILPSGASAFDALEICDVVKMNSIGDYLQPKVRYLSLATPPSNLAYNTNPTFTMSIVGYRIGEAP